MDYATMQSILGWAAIAAALVAGGIVGAMLVYDLGKPLWRRLARLWRRSPVECVAAVSLLCYCVAWGGGKITFPRTNAEYELLKDAGSQVAEDGINIRAVLHPIVPDSATIRVFSRSDTSTDDADWLWVCNWKVEDLRTPRLDDNIIAFGWGPIPNASNYNFMVFTTWQPAPAVQTNGVLHVDWWGATNGAANAEARAIHAVPFKSAVETTEGKQLAPTRPNADE